MFPASFDYRVAESIDEAISLYQSADGEARYLAGGHSLIPAMKLRLARPSRLIDIRPIEQLRYIRVGDDGAVHIGSLTTHAEIAASNVVAQHAPLLAQAAKVIGDVQVRNMGTIGGSLAHNDPGADYPAAVLALEATITVQGPNGTRHIAATDFLKDMYETALEPGEIIVDVAVPSYSGWKSTYVKFFHPASRYAVVGVAILANAVGNQVQDIRIAYNGVASCAFRDTAAENALKGKAATDATIAEAANAALNGVDVLSDHFASAEFRKHIGRVYLKRALQELFAG